MRTTQRWNIYFDGKRHLGSVTVSRMLDGCFELSDEGMASVAQVRAESLFWKYRPLVLRRVNEDGQEEQ